mmetsp:Transcript_73016/g.145191  ORF Transcript_73016/g.145191 Transcript_73016/m.145191 type:complete len:167 (+) Transcript_73016:1023-1523(+)
MLWDRRRERGGAPKSFAELSIPMQEDDLGCSMSEGGLEVCEMCTSSSVANTMADVARPPSSAKYDIGLSSRISVDEVSSGACTVATPPPCASRPIWLVLELCETCTSRCEISSLRAHRARAFLLHAIARATTTSTAAPPPAAAATMPVDEPESELDAGCSREGRGE